MKVDVYDLRRYGKVAFILATALMAGMFLRFSAGLVRDLSQQERDRMEIWAEATREIVGLLTEEDPSLTDSASRSPGVNLDFLLGIIEKNTTIPVILSDDSGEILDWRNIRLPVSENASAPENQEFLTEKLSQLSQTQNIIDISIAPGQMQHIYYEDSTLLKRLSLFPYVELAVMLAFIIVVYLAVSATTKSEQNKVWVGLSKETAHQLGTPISSLMAWIELLPDMGVDEDTVKEMDKDVKRLSVIASRFSKIGSKPVMEIMDLSPLAESSSTYMRSRISSNISLTFEDSTGKEGSKASLSAPLFEWVLENLIKNAVDALDGKGSITVKTGRSGDKLFIEVSDTGKGIRRKDIKKVFSPGFTTKKRGWGLGLTLAKRIVEQYHGGRIYVKSSIPMQGTTFRIEIPAS